MAGFDGYLIAGSALLLISVISSKITARVGVPSLLVFIALGMLMGSEGIGRIEFDDPRYAKSFGVLALAMILFAGGLSTDKKEIRPILRAGLSMGTIAVLVTTALVGYFANAVLGSSLLEGLLLGAMISSTDAAAVFTVLRGKAIGLRGKIQPLLELESGANDPLAVLLTVGFIALIQNQLTSEWNLLPMFLRSLAVGATFGVLSGKGLRWTLNQLKLEADGLYPVVTFASVVLVFASTEAIGGSGFLAVYLMGLTLGNESFIHKKSLILFHDGMAWLMQIGMFLILGLLVFPSRLVPVAGQGLLVSVFLILVARPLAVFLSLWGSQFDWREKLMISWVGLRGSVPIILATYPSLAAIENADFMFNLIFFIVLTSVLIQGTTISWVAKRLRVEAPSKPRFKFPMEYAPVQGMKNDLLEIDVPAGAFAVGKSIVEIGVPKEVLIVLIQRAGKLIVPRGTTPLAAEDSLLVLATPTAKTELVERLRVGPQEQPE